MLEETPITNRWGDDSGLPEDQNALWKDLMLLGLMAGSGGAAAAVNDWWFGAKGFHLDASSPRQSSVRFAWHSSRDPDCTRGPSASSWERSRDPPPTSPARSTSRFATS